jgi:excisionase family DNA binding protein
MTDEILLKPEEAARRLAVSRATLYRLLASGQLRSVRLGGGRRVRVSDLEALAAAKVES